MIPRNAGATSRVGVMVAVTRAAHHRGMNLLDARRFFAPRQRTDAAALHARHDLEGGRAAPGPETWFDSSQDLKHGLEVTELDDASAWPETMPGWHSGR